ncbi:MAG: hypothetical protein IJM96_01325 [Clostridia bacterium]|nr:hypothetical protein [Clostridia bacterium]
MKKFIALVLVMVMALSLFAGCAKEEPTATTAAPAGNDTTTAAPTTAAPEEGVEPIEDLILAKTYGLETFAIWNTEGANTRGILINLYEGLLDNNNKSQSIPAIAKSWGSEDGNVTWKFELRDDAKWVDVNGAEKAPVVAADFETGMEYILNFHKNGGSNTSKLIEFVKGAKEYYEYTKELEPAAAMALNAGEGSKFLELVGIETPDDHTVIYTCLKPTPYFDSLAQTTSFYPIAQGMIDEIGVENLNALTNENMWYNSCYIMTSYVSGNEMILEPNPLYWDKEAKLFNSVTLKQVESTDVAYMLFENGENDYVTLNYTQVMEIYNDPNHKYHDYLVEQNPGMRANQMHFNYDKYLADGTPDTNWNLAINNLNFRKAMYYGIDFLEYYKRFNPINPMNCENNFYTRADLVYMSDGTQYVEVVRDEMGIDEKSDTKIAQLNPAKAEEHKKLAIEELTAQGVTFPVVIEYYIGSSQDAVDNAKVLEQSMEECLGADFIDVKLMEYGALSGTEVRDNGMSAFAINSYAGAFADPSTYLTQEIYGDANAFYTTRYSRINNLPTDSETSLALQEYTRLFNEANAITDDHDARLKAFAKAEAYFFDQVITVPVYITNSYCLTNIDLNSQMYSMLGGSAEKMKNWETDLTGYTSAEMEAIRAEAK